jgi:hypothetical protein
MSSESVSQVARSWVDVGSLHKRWAVSFMIFTASVRNILDSPPYCSVLQCQNFNLKRVKIHFLTAKSFALSL